MRLRSLPGLGIVALIATGFAVGTGCSGEREDVRVTLCKHLTESLLAQRGSLEWTGQENMFQRPEYAITVLRFALDGGEGRTGQSACHYAYEALEDTALNLANPLDAYATLPFAMTLDGRALPDAELLAAVNAEQKRLGRQVLDSLDAGARDMADRVRATLSR